MDSMLSIMALEHKGTTSTLLPHKQVSVCVCVCVCALPVEAFPAGCSQYQLESLQA